MMEKIMEDEGIGLYKSNNKYFLRYDAGELMIKMKNLEISEEEARSVINNPDTSYDIIISYQNKGIYGENL
jgi:hypothetical protein